MHFHLDSLWHAEEGAMEFALTNCGDTPVANPRLVYATLTRCLRPSRCTGGAADTAAGEFSRVCL